MLKKIVKYSTTWCGPCRAFQPTFREVSEMEKYNGITFEQVDVDNDEMADVYCEKYQIRSVPTTILFDENDTPIVKLMGNQSKNDFIRIIDEKMEQV